MKAFQTFSIPKGLIKRNKNTLTKTNLNHVLRSQTNIDDRKAYLILTTSPGRFPKPARQMTVVDVKALIEIVFSNKKSN